jgi:protein-tyrosine phosphatase
MQQVLFLCTANYYRSRFAEHYFNWLAGQANLAWRADSRGLDTESWSHHRQMSRHAAERLARRGVPLAPPHRDPKRLTLADLARSDLVIAVKETEHRPLMAERFPLWTERVEYWHVDDLDCARPDEAMPRLENCVRELVARLLNQQDHAVA